ncbi:MAG: UDP-N-acetylmuramate dehydrogenase [Candidatus Aminicenantes bacterium]|nr:UDP-N-acetylmuramate dehydrogenase [Candidatus Aminicenantes bacterium]
MKSLARLLSLPGIICRQPDNSGNYTTIGIGGNVGMSLQAITPSSLIAALQIIRREKVAHVVIGGGSNTVFPEAAPELVLVINRTRGIRRIARDRIAVQSGESTLNVVAWCANNGVKGLEFLAGIPGTIGGAVAVNAGAFGRDLSACFIQAQRLNGRGKVTPIQPAECNFQYRDSLLKRGDSVLLEIILAVEPDDPKVVRQRIRRNFSYRRQNHPGWNARTAGCFFKNPGRDKAGSAGRLIDTAGLRGWRRSGLEVSQQHANFIFNHGNAQMTDLQAFIQHITSVVMQKHGVRLEREVVFVTPDGKRY